MSRPMSMWSATAWAKINLSGPDGRPELVSNDGLKTGDLRRAMRIVAEQQAALLKRWKDCHA